MSFNYPILNVVIIVCPYNSSITTRVHSFWTHVWCMCFYMKMVRSQASRKGHSRYNSKHPKINNICSLNTRNQWYNCYHPESPAFTWSILRHSVILLGLYLLSERMSCRKISWSLKVARLDVIMLGSLWNLTGNSAALLPRCLSNFTAIGKV